MLFGRNYELSIQNPAGEQIDIAPPFTIHFNITRNTLASANSITLEIKNLSPTTRGKLYKDRYTVTQDWQMVLRAGYGDNLYTVFSGNIYQIYNVKSGTEWETQIEGYDGFYATQNSFTFQSFSAGTSLRNQIESTIGDFSGLLTGAIGSLSGLGEDTERGSVRVGPTNQVLQDMAGGQAFIDNGMVNILADDEAIANNPVVIIDSDLLLKSPARRETFIDCHTLFLPQCAVKSICQLESVDPIYNGQYQVLGFTHDVTISAAESGSATSTINLYSGAASLV